MGCCCPIVFATFDQSISDFNYEVALILGWSYFLMALLQGGLISGWSYFWVVRDRPILAVNSGPVYLILMCVLFHMSYFSNYTGR